MRILRVRMWRVFAINPTATNAAAKSRIEPSRLSILVFKPILAKKTGPNNIIILKVLYAGEPLEEAAAAK